MAAHLTAGTKLKFGYPKSRQQHDATIDKLKAETETPIKPSLKILLIRGFIMVVYLLLGALVFRALEHEDEDPNARDTLAFERKQLQLEFNISDVRLKRFEDLVRKRRQEPKDWDYYQSLYFASTVTTTIGYGHITPQTQSGRIFLIIFALIGIPLNILALASVGEHITVAIFNFLRYVSSHCCCQKKKNRIKHINIKVMMVSVFLMVCMLFIGGLLYCSTEEWSYVDSIYYCFVAMATIGFGDLVPNKGRAPDSEGEKAIWFLRALYLSVGLSLVSTVFTALSNAMEEINFLLGRYKNDLWEFGHSHTNNNDDGNGKRPKKVKGGDTEKISYKHKIKKQGNIVFKYKLLHKLKRRKDEGCIHTDWDSLLAEANRKQHTVLESAKTAGADIKKPSLLLLTNQKGFVPERYSLKTYQKTNVLTIPVTPDGGETTSTTNTEGESKNPPPRVQYQRQLRHRNYEEHIQQNSTSRIQRMHSSPNPVINHDREFIVHSSVSRTSSQPIGYSKNLSHHSQHKPFIANNNNTHSLRQSPNYGDNTRHRSNTEHFFNVYEDEWYAHSYGDNKHVSLGKEGGTFSTRV
ncbi:uncharacterized protein [Clytia hemisphaerica]|uniref:Potassium channel domain-containing protein n=1 Tax=Clytia hemisphaerica TaxID=252671 RepID=A0A7M5XKZ5_9CNID